MVFYFSLYMPFLVLVSSPTDFLAILDIVFY